MGINVYQRYRYMPEESFSGEPKKYSTILSYGPQHAYILNSL